MIKVISEGINISIKFHTFSGGEEHVTIDTSFELKNKLFTIFAQVTSSSELMRLLLVTDAIKRNYSYGIELFMPYIPYARQDRACQIGDAFSLRVFAGIINSQDYKSVTVVDPHSSVSHALFNKIIVKAQDLYAHKVKSRLSDIAYIVSPDLGAQRKANDWLYKWNSLGGKPAELLIASKKRNSEGQIISTELDYDGTISGECLIVDDICDGGRTFLELAKVLRERGASKVYLYVTHGILTNGVAGTGCDKVFTTDSLPEKDDGRIVVQRFFNI